MFNIFNSSKYIVSMSLLVAFVLGGCATARTVSMQPGKGGVVSLNPPQNPEARAKAEELMRSNCHGKKFEIVEEGEAVIGQEVYGKQDTSLGKSSIWSTSSSTTENKTEWRITYKCI
ncbi:MAG: hypothetical protein HY072_06725 [Deltaproteobacteria bacterium]|nr:hypothetical protein [Deltaproteobacteria bacterium]